MEILSKADTLKAIQEATAPLLKEITILRKLVTDNREMVSTEEAMERTGIKDLRTLKKRIPTGWTQEGTGPIKWSKVAILEYLERKSIAA